MKNCKLLKKLFVCLVAVVVVISAAFVCLDKGLLDGGRLNNAETLERLQAFEQKLAETGTENQIETTAKNCSTVLDLQKNVSTSVFESESKSELLENLPFEILKDKVEEQGYNIIQGNEGYVVYKKFALKRIIVDGNITNNYGATDDISGYKNYHVLTYESVEQASEAYDKLTNDGVKAFEDEIVSTSGYESNSYNYSTYKSWGAEAMDVGGIKDYISTHSYTTKNDVVIAVLDTGINTAHAMFSGRMLTDASGNLVGGSYYTSNYTYSGYAFEDDNKHGTHVSGTIVELTPSNVKILPIKIFTSSGKGTTSAILSGLAKVEEFSNTYTIFAVNMSLGGRDTSYLNSFTSAFESFRNKKILPVVAAGNDSINTNLCEPAGCANAIVVSALKKGTNGNLAFDNSYSNYGEEVDVSAPGTAINSASISTNNTSVSDAYETLSGTSMAAPHVSAAVALLTLVKSNTNFSADSIEQLLFDNTIDLGETGKDIYYGYGCVNLRFFNVDISNESVLIKDQSTDISSQRKYEFNSYRNFSLSASNTNYEVYYSIGVIPSAGNETSSETFYANKSSNLYYYAVKKVAGEVVARTKIKSIILFYNSGNIEDYFETSGSTITSYSGYFETLTIPEKINGVTIKSLGPYVFKGTELVSVTFPSSIGSIGGYVFEDCLNLKYVNAPGVTKLYIAAFNNCQNIKFVKGSSPLASDTEGVYLPSLAETTKLAFANCSGLKTVNLPKLTTTSYALFYNCTSLEECSIPNATLLEEDMFSNCSKLTSFFIGSNVETINSPFYGSGLKKLTVSTENNYFYFDGNGVYGDNELKLAAINDNESYEIKNEYLLNGTTYKVKKISEWAFGNTNSRVNCLVIPENIETFTKGVFQGTINTLKIKSKSLNCSGYTWIDENNEKWIASPFRGIIKTIETSSEVSALPNSMFALVVAPEYLVLNSKSTIVEDRACFSKPNGTISGIYLNFKDVDLEFINSLKNANFDFDNAEYIYSNSEIPSSYLSSRSGLACIENGSNCKVYSSNTNNIKVSIETEGVGGSVSPSSFVMVKSGNDVSLSYSLQSKTELSAVYVNGSKISTSNLETIKQNVSFVISGLKSDTTVKFIFKSSNVYSYMVKHWYESLSGGTLIDGLYYTLETIKSYEAEAGTTIDPETYVNVKAGFVPQPTTSFVLPNNDNTIVDILYNRRTATLSVVAGDGILSVSGSGTYKYGERVGIYATPVEGYVFSTWKSNISAFVAPTSQSATITMPLYNLTLTATGKSNFCTITFESYSNGTISPSPTNGIYKISCGSDITFQFTPNAGYVIQDVYVDGSSKGSVNLYTFSCVSDDHTVRVVFALRKQYDYIVKHWKESLTTTEYLVGGKYYYLEMSETLRDYQGEKTKATSKSFEGFLVENFRQQEITNSTVVNIFYTRKVFSLTIIPGTGISSVVGAGNYKYGQIVTIDAVLVDTYNWDKWASLVDGFVAPTSKNATFTMPAFNLKLAALSSADKMKISFTFENATISPSLTDGVYKLDRFLTVTFSFLPNAEYAIEDVLIDGTSVGAITSFTFENVQTNHTVEIKVVYGTCDIVIEKSDEGEVSCSGTTNVINSGESRTFIVTPKENYVVDRVYVNGVETVFENNSFTIGVYAKQVKIKVVYKFVGNGDDGHKNTVTIGGREVSIGEIAIYITLAVLVIVLVIVTIIVSSRSKHSGSGKRDTFE